MILLCESAHFNHDNVSLLKHNCKLSTVLVHSSLPQSVAREQVQQKSQVLLGLWCQLVLNIIQMWWVLASGASDGNCRL